MSFTHNIQSKKWVSLFFQVVFALTFCSNIFAQDSTFPSEIKLHHERIALQNHSGLIYTVAHYPSSKLGPEIRQRTILLQKHKKDLSLTAKRSRFNAVDVVIIGAVPGGLLYAAIKKYSLISAEKKLIMVEQQLTSLNQSQQDLIALEHTYQIANNLE